MSEWNSTEGTCRPCKGTGLYLVDVADPAVTDPRECLACGGAGKVEKPGPVTAEQKAEGRKAEIGALFKPRPPQAEPVVPVETAEAFRRKAHAWWGQDRAARIRKGACPVCAEKGCPTVGGKDDRCVTV